MAYTIQSESDDDSTSLSNVVLEQAILGALLSDSHLTLWPQITTRLKPEHFSEHLHSRIYEAAAATTATGVPVSPLTLGAQMASDVTLKGMGGSAYLANLVGIAEAPIYFMQGVDTLQDLAARRAAVAAADDMRTAAQEVNPGENVRPALAACIGTLQTLFDKGSARRTTFSAHEAGRAMVDRIKKIREGGKDPNAIKTGIASFDRMTGGLHRGEFIVLGARPSVGKSALAVQIALNVAQAGGGVGYASLEMSEEQLISRLISSQLWTPQGATNVPYERIRQANLNATEERWIGDLAQELEACPLFIDTQEGLNAAELEARANIMRSRLSRTGKSLDLLIVDHLHKMAAPGTRSDVEKFSEISARLAEMAKRLNCPVLALAQLNRGLESRDDKRPHLSDLRASGSIEQDADVALFVHRPAYHLARVKHLDPMKDLERLEELNQTQHIFEVLIEKQRNGPIGTVELFADMGSNVIRDPSEVMGIAEAAA